ncbi:hypothetical protein Q1695_006249 [Nippostrongylus brasiliensis]|nr:hypothetical protein Q1695_006249 [Nippostrongylus brasiliensis]
MSRKPQVRVTFFSEFVDESIDELLDVGAIETVEAKPRVVSPLAVAQGLLDFNFASDDELSIASEMEVVASESIGLSKLYEYEDDENDNDVAIEQDPDTPTNTDIMAAADTDLADLRHQLLKLSKVTSSEGAKDMRMAAELIANTLSQVTTLVQKHHVPSQGPGLNDGTNGYEHQ